MNAGLRCRRVALGERTAVACSATQRGLIEATHPGLGLIVQKLETPEKAVFNYTPFDRRGSSFFRFCLHLSLLQPSFFLIVVLATQEDLRLLTHTAGDSAFTAHWLAGGPRFEVAGAIEALVRTHHASRRGSYLRTSAHSGYLQCAHACGRKRTFCWRLHVGKRICKCKLHDYKAIIFP